MGRNRARCRLLSSEHLLPIVILTLVNLRVLTWLQPGHVMFSGDFRPFLTWDAFLINTNNVWTLIDFGTPSFYFVEKYSLFNLLSIALYAVTRDLTMSQIIATYTLYVVYSLTGYLLYYIITESSLISLVAAFFLTTNPLLINDREITAVGFVTYYYLPTLIVLLTYTYSLKKINRFYALSSGLLTFLATSSLPNPRTIIYVTSLVIYMTLFYILKKRYLNVKLEKTEKTFSITFTFNKNGIINMFKNLCLFSLGSLTVYIPMINLYISERRLITDAMQSALNIISSPEYVRNINPVEFLRFIYRWGFFSGALNRPYIPYRELYMNSLLFKLLTYSISIIVIASFASSLIYRRYRLNSVMFSILYLFGILIPVGVVFSDTVFIIFTKNVVLRSLIDPLYLAFYSTISAGAIIGIGVQILGEKIKRNSKRDQVIFGIAIFMLLVLLSIISYPLFTGDVTRNWLSPNVRGYAIPIKAYEDLAESISKDYWTFVVPQKHTYLVFNESSKLWGSGNPYPKILGFPYVSGLGTEYIKSPSDSFIRFVFSLFNNGKYSSEDVVKFLSLIGVKYILIENNIVLGSLDDPKSYLDLLLKPSNVKVSSQSSDRVLLELHEANRIMYAARRYLFYSSYEDIIDSVQSIRSLSDVVGLVFVDSSNGFIRNLLQNLQSVVGGEIRKIQVVSPSHYIVEAYSNGYLILVLQQSYDDNWVVYVNGTPLDQIYHFKANGYGNGWLIPVKGHLKIEIIYRPNIVNLSVMIASTATTFTFIGYFLIENITYRRRHHVA